MAIRKLYGAIDSISTMRALTSLFEHEVEFEFVTVDLKSGEHMKTSFLALNPFGQVPVYQEGDMVIFESRAIMRAISHTYPKTQKEQIYMDPKLQGIAAAWIDVEDHEFNPPASTLITELIFNNGSTTDDSTVAQAKAQLAKVLDVYEERLKESNYLGGDKFTSADLTHIPSIYYLMKTPAKQLFDERIHVSKWCNDILSRPVWAKMEEMLAAAAKK